MPPSSARTSQSICPPDGLVFIVDDDESVRRGLSRLLRSYRVDSESFPSARAYLNRPLHNGPFCIVLDVRMPDIDGLELQQQLMEHQAQIVFITGHGDVPMCAEAMKAGAVDFLTKPVGENELLNAVSRAMKRSADMQKNRAEHSAARALLDKLTPREFQVMQRVIAGCLNKQIADELGAAEKTIKIHRGRVMEKMAVSSVAELVRIAHVAGVAPAAVSG